MSASPSRVRARTLDDRRPVADGSAVDHFSATVAYWGWCLVLAPGAGLTAAMSTQGDGGLAKCVFLFVGVPALLAVGGAAATRQRLRAVLGGPILAAALGGLTWFVILLLVQGGPF